MDMLDKNQCIVLVGETGSGKTTQVGWSVSFEMGHFIISSKHLH